MTNRREHARRVEEFKGAFYDFQDAASNAELNRLDPSGVARSRNTVVYGWALFAEALNSYSLLSGSKKEMENNGVSEVLKCLTQDHQPDTLLAANAHYLFQKFTFNDLEQPGDFLAGLKSPQLEQAVAFCLGIYNVGFSKNDIDMHWPIVPLDENVWSALSSEEREFMRMFTSFYKSFGGVPLSAVDNFPRTKIVSSDKQRRSILLKLSDLGLVNKRPLELETIYECSKSDPQFFGWK